MSSTGRAATLLVVAAVVVAGVVVAAYRHEQERAASEANVDAAAPDASTDGRATVAKAKAPAKKKKGRGGKTQVIGRTHSAGKSGGVAKHAPPSSPHTAAAAHTAPSQNVAPPPEAFMGDQDEGHAAPAAPAAPRPHRHYGKPSGATYETVVGSNNHPIDMGGHSGADLTDAQLAGPMSDGWFVGECDAPDSMSVTVKVAIKMGRAVGVSVSTSPHSSDVANCIDHHVRALKWPASPKLDSFVTTY